jgi:uncharacterized protein YceH (UPF0502 family)
MKALFPIAFLFVPFVALAQQPPQPKDPMISTYDLLLTEANSRVAELSKEVAELSKEINKLKDAAPKSEPDK